VGEVRSEGPVENLRQVLCCLCDSRACVSLKAVGLSRGVFRSPRLESGQLDRAAGLIANDHLFPPKALDRLPVRGPRLLACGRVLLGSMARLFFRVSPQRVNTRLIVLRLTRTCTASASFSPRSAKAAAGC